MAETITDLDDILRAQKMRAFWDTYGVWLVGLVLGILLAVGGALIWKSVMNNRYNEQSNALMKILENKDGTPEDAQKLTALADKAAAPLNNVVALYAAQRYEQDHKLADAQAAYKAVMDRPQATTALKNAATLHFVRLGMILKNDSASLLPLLNDMAANAQQPFFGSATELKGLLLQQQGKNAEANALFKTLSTTETVPATLRQRAKSLMSYGTVNAQ